MNESALLKVSHLTHWKELKPVTNPSISHIIYICLFSLFPSFSPLLVPPLNLWVRVRLPSPNPCCFCPPLMVLHPSSVVKGQGIGASRQPLLCPRSTGMLIVCNPTQCLSSATQTGPSNHPETNTMNVSVTHIEISVSL